MSIKKEAPRREPRGKEQTGKPLGAKGEETISTAPEDVKTSGNALSADERRFLARAEISFQKQRIAMLRAECHEAVRRIRRARRILGEGEQ